jgi:hypothetical protein
MKKALAEVSRQRVEMRYEMFSAPIPRADLERLIADGAPDRPAAARAKGRR